MSLRSVFARCCVKEGLKSNLLLIVLAITMVLGIGAGFLIREVDPDLSEDDRRIMYLNFPGELLIRMLKLIVVPVVILSLISGVANLPLEAMGKLGWRVIAYYFGTTFMAVCLGILLVLTIKPGSRGQDAYRANKEDPYVHPVDSLLDLIRNMFPSNLFEATFHQTKTEYVTHEEYYINDAGENVTKRVVDSFGTKLSGSSNVLGLIVFSIALGLMMGRMREQGMPLRIFFSAFSEAVIRIVRIIIYYSPVGIFFLLAAKIAGMDDPADAFSKLGYYILTVLLGLAIHGFILLPTLYFIFVRKNPFKFMGSMSQALLTALGTASSAATLPVTMHCLETKAAVSPVISKFVLPVGATINMDGTALYEAVASIFIAQMNDIDLSAGEVITVSVTATAAAIGAAGVPEAGLVTMLIVLTAVGLPTEDIALIYAVDWFLDRCRTSINVWGDSIGAGIMHAAVGDDLDAELMEEDQPEKFSDESKGKHNQAYMSGGMINVQL